MERRTRTNYSEDVSYVARGHGDVVNDSAVIAYSAVPRLFGQALQSCSRSRACLPGILRGYVSAMEYRARRRPVLRLSSRRTPGLYGRFWGKSRRPAADPLRTALRSRAVNRGAPWPPLRVAGLTRFPGTQISETRGVCHQLRECDRITVLSLLGVHEPSERVPISFIDSPCLSEESEICILHIPRSEGQRQTPTSYPLCLSP